MGNTIVINKSNLILNFGLMVVCPYYYENQMKPSWNVTFDLGCVWYSQEVIPWFGPDSEITSNVPSACGHPEWYNYEDNFDEIKVNITRFGNATLGYLKLVGHNLTQLQVDERLRNLSFWSDGNYACSKTYCINGGPAKDAIKDSGKTINITKSFDKINVTICG